MILQSPHISTEWKGIIWQWVSTNGKHEAPMRRPWVSQVVFISLATRGISPVFPARKTDYSWLEKMINFTRI